MHQALRAESTMGYMRNLKDGRGKLVLSHSHAPRAGAVVRHSTLNNVPAWTLTSRYMISCWCHGAPFNAREQLTRTDARKRVLQVEFRRATILMTY